MNPHRKMKTSGKAIEQIGLDLIRLAPEFDNVLDLHQLEDLALRLQEVSGEVNQLSKTVNGRQPTRRDHSERQTYQTT